MDVINLYGGPGSGKSTVAAEVYGILKRSGVVVEIQREWCKGPVWDEYHKALKDQYYIFAKHYRELARFERGNVKVVVSDAPLLLSMIYGHEEGTNFRSYVWDVYRRFSNFNVFLERDRKYHRKGRLQTKRQALDLDSKIKAELIEIISVHTVENTPTAASAIVTAWKASI